MDESRARVLLAERRARRERAERQAQAEALAAELRAFYYPKQAAFYTSKAKRRASRKTRRAGATAGGCRELLARAVTTPRFRAVYVGETRPEARQRAWESDTQSGLIDLLRRYGRPIDRGSVDWYELGGIEVEVREQELALNFSNGGRIELFGADDERSLNKQRGLAKHVYWIDEAQSFRWLERFYKAVIVAAMADFDGECWLTGTPDRDCAGMFYEATRDDGQPTLAGWEVHEFAAVDNPYFGATPEERWARTAEKARAENGWSPEDPDFLREWCGRWVKTDANFVYAANAVADHELFYAPHRLREDGFPDLDAALMDLPGIRDDPARDYYFALAADLGTRDDFAFVLNGWSLQDPVLYEVASWKRPGFDYDEMFEVMLGVMGGLWVTRGQDRRQLAVSYLIADAGGGGKPAVKGWSKKVVDRYGLPIIEATKTNKEVAIKQLNNDLRRGLYRLRRGSPLVAEMRVHRWAPRPSSTGRRVEDSTTPNHCCDASLYAHRESYHHRYREKPLQPERGTAEWLQREEAELESAAQQESDLWSSW